VLLAEDEEINRVVAQALLAKLGVRTEIARNGREAVEMTGARDYDAILMDCMMPELDGLQATREIRAAERGRHVPIIAMTALAMSGDRERCLLAGMDDYLSKPARLAALETAIRRAAAHRREG
jgi:CheY-like chemotaxis protein